MYLPYVCIAIVIVRKLMRTYKCLEIFSKEVLLNEVSKENQVKIIVKEK